MVWLNRVEAYLDDLELAVDGLARQIKQMKVDQVPAPRIGSDAGRGIDGSMARSITSATERLSFFLTELESKVAQRELLLRAPDAPQTGLTLNEKLGTIRGPGRSVCNGGAM